MAIALSIVFLVCFVVFMFTTDGVSDSAKRVVLGLTIVLGFIIVIKVIGG